MYETDRSQPYPGLREAERRRGGIALALCLSFPVATALGIGGCHLIDALDNPPAMSEADKECQAMVNEQSMFLSPVEYLIESGKCAQLEDSVQPLE